VVNESARSGAPAETARFAPAAVEAFIRRAGAAAGIPGDDLDLFVDGLLLSDLRGIDSHGVYRVPFYCRGFASGALNPRPHLRRLRGRGATELLDGDNGLGVVVGQRAMQRAVELSRDFGVGMVGVANSNHAGMLAAHVLHASRAGMLGWFLSNAPALMAPWGGREAMLSNSPFAWAIPCRPDPIGLDMACSSIARGRIRIAALRDGEIPEGCATDANGLPTTNARRAMEGLVLPAGGYKGYGIALVNEILSAVLPAATLSVDVSRQFLAANAQEQDAWGIGHLAVAIDPSAFQDPDTFLDRVTGLAERIRGSRPALGVDVVLLPGDPELVQQRQRQADGIPIAANVLDQLSTYAREVGIEPIDGRSPA
jgi:LDH2 family malate/lactate/ureidoglycolate dehydrogenase